MALMDIISAKDAKNRFGHLLNTVQIAPVEIQKHGTSVAVILSAEEYYRLEHMEDRYWLAKAEEARKDGFVAPEQGEALLAEILNEAR